MPETKMPDYITCAGVRVPAHWSVGMLEEALAKRNIRFANEAEIMAVFGDALQMKADLEKAIGELTDAKRKLEVRLEVVKAGAHCPHCLKSLVEEDAASHAPKSRG